MLYKRERAETITASALFAAHQKPLNQLCTAKVSNTSETAKKWFIKFFITYYQIYFCFYKTFH